MIAIFCAEAEEAGAVRELLSGANALDLPWPAWRGQAGALELVVVETGVGKVAAASAVTYLQARFQPDFALFAGVAGALAEIPRGAVVVASEAVQWDVDLSPLGRAPGELDSGERFITPDPQLKKALLVAAGELDLPVYEARIATGDAFLADPAAAARLRQEFGALAVEMEGAAALWSAQRLGLPMALVRVVTDGADQAAPAGFNSFLDWASARLAQVVGRAVAKLPAQTS